MSVILVEGGRKLSGAVTVQGAKNSVLPMLAATVLCPGVCCLRGCPALSDVDTAVQIIRHLGGTVHREGPDLVVDTRQITGCEIPEELMGRMRSSVMFLGAILGRCGEAVCSQPGGCDLGPRPIDLHLYALRAMGAEIEEKSGRLRCRGAALHGAEIFLRTPSVGATENILLAAVKADGDTRILGAAREPEVTALCEFLTACGAQIEGIGGSELLVHGDRPLHSTRYTVPSDRIVAGTYLFACIGCGGSVLLTEAPWEQMEAVTFVAEKMGAQCITSEEGLFVQCSKRPQAIPYLRTGPYPGFPTDLQSVAMAVLTKAEGCSCIEENIFENRFRIAEPLKGMGAEIVLKDGRHAVITGVEHLRGSRMEACELRGGAALVLAGLAAEGESFVTGQHFIERGYENICRDLRELGARIISV